MRWSAPAWRVAGWLSCGAPFQRPPLAAAFVGAPVVAALAWLLPWLRGAAFVRHLLAMNAALAVGFARCVAGRGTATWQRTGRTGVPRSA